MNKERKISGEKIEGNERIWKWKIKDNYLFQFISRFFSFFWGIQLALFFLLETIQEQNTINKFVRFALSPFTIQTKICN